MDNNRFAKYSDDELIDIYIDCGVVGIDLDEDEEKELMLEMYRRELL